MTPGDRVNARVTALLDDVKERADRHVCELFATMDVREVFRDELALLSKQPVALGGNHYELWIVQAQLRREVIPGKAKLVFSVVLFSPVGELGARRERALARGDDPYDAFFRDMALDLAPGSPDVQALLAQLHGVLAEVCNGARYTTLCLTTTGALELVAVFVDVASFHALAVEVGRG